LTLEQPMPKTLTMSEWLANALLLFTLFPYISPVPLKSDIQLVSAVLAMLVIFVRWWLDREAIKFSWSELGIFVMALIYLCYATPASWLDYSEVIRKSAAMMLGFFVYLAAKLSYRSFSVKIVMAAAIVHLGVAMLQSVSPDLHKAIIQPFLSQIRGAEDRGVGGACSEPSFLANIGILLPIIAWVVAGNGSNKLTKGAWILVWVAVAGLIGLSQAATASVYGIVILIVFGISRGLKSGLITTAVTVVLGMSLVAAGPSMPSSRATDLVKVAFDNPRLIIEDPSASMRLVGHYLAGPSLIEKPFGNGLIKLDQDYFWFLWNKYNIDTWYEVDISRMSGQYYAIGYGLTDFGASTLRMGWVFIGLLVFWLLQYRGSKYSPAVIAFVALGVLSSIPIVFPAYWLLLGCVQADRERRASLETIPQTL